MSSIFIVSVARIPVVLLLHFAITFRRPDEQANPDGCTDQTDDASKDEDDFHASIIAL